VSRQIAVPVLTISEEMSVVSIQCNGVKKTLESIPRVLARADQALQILDRYRKRLDAATAALSALEVEDLVTARDVAEVLQRAQMVRRVADEVEGYVIELGTDGRLVALQLEELVVGLADEVALVCKDYARGSVRDHLDDLPMHFAAIDDDTLLDGRTLLACLGFGAHADLNASLTPRGHRLLAKIPRLGDDLADRVVGRYDSLAKLMRASAGELVEIDGIGEARARTIKDGLSRLAETSILERYS
jgi:diadenylate cyclase